MVKGNTSGPGIVDVLSKRFGGKSQVGSGCLFSHKLSTMEHNYDTGNCKLLAVKLALEVWRHWLEGAAHKNLEYVCTAKRLDPHQTHWELFFTRFQFIVPYCPRSKNTKVDALSQIHPEANSYVEPENILQATCFVKAMTWDFDQELVCTLPYQIPVECSPGRSHIPTRLQGKLITGAHTSLDSPGHL